MSAALRGAGAGLTDAMEADAAAQAAGDCFHCGLPLQAGTHWSVCIDGIERRMCCPGCESVARVIIENGLSDYYRNRAGYAGPVDQASLVPAELKLYDAPGEAQFAKADGAGCEASFSIEGMRCAACVWLIERRLARVSGILAANVNAATECVHVRWDPTQCQPSAVLQAMRDIGYHAYPYDAARHEAQLRRAGKTLFRQWFIAGLAMMQVMMYAVPAYLADDGTLEPDMASLMRWASLLLTLPAVCYSAQPFFKGAWANVRQHALGMDVPVALGIAAGFIGSVVATLRGQGEVYFDSVTMFIFLLLCSRYLELHARRKAASAMQKLQHAAPASAWRLQDYPRSSATELVPAARLLQDDIILIKPGEAVATDGIIVEGATAIDTSLLTGESVPQPVSIGDTIPGGAVNIAQPILARITKPAADSTLSALVKLVERAGQGKPRLAQWADQVAGWFVAALLVFAVMVFVAWQWFDPARAWPIAIAVLVVSCPCALSLATPTALAAATDQLLRQGVLAVQSHVLETLHRATHVVFDKTGTLTWGQPVLQHVERFGTESGASCVAIAAALDASSAHPLAKAFFMAAEPQVQWQARDTVHTMGQGVAGVIDATLYRLGTAAFVAELAGSAPPDAHASNDMTQVYLGTQNGWLARFDLADAIRGDAHQVIAELRRLGKTIILLSGDRQAVVQQVAADLNIGLHYAEHLPEQKLALVQQLQAQGAVVAMVGDGINDAAVLRAADVSFAMASGAALAQMQADAVLLSGRLFSITDTVRVASKTMQVIRQNLIWASLYNLVAIPAAALGYLNPWLSGIGMSLSSAIVVANALRLRREVHAPSGMAGQPVPAAWRAA